MIFAKLNAGADDSLVAQYYKVKGYPTFIVTESNGEEIDRIIGYREAEDFLTIVNNYRQGIGTLADLLKQAENSDDRSLFYEIADKYKYRGGNNEAREWYQKVIDAGEATDSLSSESRFSLADMIRRNKDYDGAIKEFESIKADFDDASYQEEADIWIAIIYRYKADTATSIQKFEEFIANYPESEDLDYAEKQIKKLKGEIEVED
jgi:tetratricopeptide (TPR) repeat protein